jgi:DNA-binding SARP family transcriptional activator
MVQRWRIELLGGCRARWEGAPPLVIERFPTRKTALLLAYLALQPRRGCSREQLIDLFWPESDLPAGRHSLSRALSSLRSALEPPSVPGGSVLRADRASIGLASQAVTIDVDEFEGALQRAAKAGSALQRVEALRQAVDLYQGELLPDSPEAWVLDRRGWLGEQFFAAASRLAEILKESGDSGRAVEAARRAVDADPFREEAHRLLIRMLLAAGRPDAARRQYEALKYLLDRELGAAPAESTRSLFASPAASPPRSLAPSPSRPVAPSASPAGTVTFLLIDLDGAIARREDPDGVVDAALGRRLVLLREVVTEHEGREVRGSRDGFLAAFSSATSALTAAIAGQRVLAGGDEAPRMALHTGDV